MTMKKATSKPLSSQRRSNGRAGLTGTPKTMSQAMADHAQDQILNQPVQLVMGVKPGHCIRCEKIKLSTDDIANGRRICMYCTDDIARQTKTLERKAAKAAEKASKAI